jgi:N-acetylglucosaminyldiphosphoundecaprenol N-acetyl-beta-D-mannosaminyltransferase
MIEYRKSDFDGNQRVEFLGVTFNQLTHDETLKLILERDADLPFAPVVTPNADHLVRISRSGDEIAVAYDQAWLCVNDSRIVQFLATLKKIHLPAVPGSTLLEGLFNDPNFNPDWPILFVGAQPQMIAKVVERYSLTNITHYDAPMGLLKDKQKFQSTVDAIIASPARFTVLAVGSPQQELIAKAVSDTGSARGVAFCTGAAVEFLAFPDRRAPQWISKIGMEWLYRLLQEPTRLWRRYLVDCPKILMLFLREFRKNRTSDQ